MRSSRMQGQKPWLSGCRCHGLRPVRPPPHSHGMLFSTHARSDVIAAPSPNLLIPTKAQPGHAFCTRRAAYLYFTAAISTCSSSSLPSDSDDCDSDSLDSLDSSSPTGHGCVAGPKALRALQRQRSRARQTASARAASARKPASRVRCLFALSDIQREPVRRA